MADLNGDGFVTQSELFAYVDENVYRITAHRQNPQFLPAKTEAASGLALMKVSAENAARVTDLLKYWPGR